MRFHGNQVKIGVRNRKKNSLQASFFLLSLNFLLKRCVKESITALYDRIKKCCRNKISKLPQIVMHLGYITPLFCKENYYRCNKWIMLVKLPSYVTTFSNTEEGLYTRNTYFVDHFYRNNYRKIGFVATSWIFLFNFFTGILVQTTLWIYTQGYSPTWKICGNCKMSEYLLNNVLFKLFDILFQISANT